MCVQACVSAFLCALVKDCLSCSVVKAERRFTGYYLSAQSRVATRSSSAGQRHALVHPA